MNANPTSLSVEPFTSSEPGAWSNSYLIAGDSEAILFDVFMLRSDTEQIADGIAKSGKRLTTVMVSHAHPDHFMGLEVITERFPQVRVVSTVNVVADIKGDGPWMLSLLQSKLGEHGPRKLVIPEALNKSILTVDGIPVEIMEFGECEAKHMAVLHIPQAKSLLAADLVYNQAHLYLQERHIESWLTRLDELENFSKGKAMTFYPGHGKAGGIELIDQTRVYLHEFEDALNSSDPRRVEERMLLKFPAHHVKQFLTMFSIPAYFPTKDAQAIA